ncbi:MAG: LysR substrate-binding domain-containing protein [Pseudomonadota bacterium]
MHTQAQTSPPFLDLDLLRTLDAIAEGGSFSAAAEIVHRTPSAISMQVKRMEDVVGRPLFERDSRSVTLTDDGAFLLTHARRVLALNRDAMARFVTPDLHGNVRLGAPDDIAERYLPRMLRRFAETHPGIGVVVTVENSARMLEMLAAGQLDLTLANTQDNERSLAGREVLLQERLVWAGAAGGCAATRTPMPLSAWDETCAWRKAATQALDRIGTPWQITFQSGHMAAQRAALKADLAVAPMPQRILDSEISEVPAEIGLPPLPGYAIILDVADDPSAPVLAAADHLRASFALCC